MSVKGQITTAEPLEFKDFLRLLSSLHEDGNYLWELYCCISFCTACRVSDVLSMTWKDVLDRDALYKIEQKTGKTRQIPFNENVQRRITSLYKLLGSPDNGCRSSATQKQKKPYTTQYINDTLKYLRVKYRLPIKRFSSHTIPQDFRPLRLRIDGTYHRSAHTAVDDFETLVTASDNGLSGNPAGRDCRSFTEPFNSIIDTSFAIMITGAVLT